MGSLHWSGALRDLVFRCIFHDVSSFPLCFFNQSSELTHERQQAHRESLSSGFLRHTALRRPHLHPPPRPTRHRNRRRNHPTRPPPRPRQEHLRLANENRRNRSKCPRASARKNSLPGSAQPTPATRPRLHHHH